MTDSKKIYKLYPSSAAFANSAGKIETEYSSGCLRYILIKQDAERIQIHPKYAEVGAVHEDWYATELGDGLDTRELAFKSNITEDVVLSGRYDFRTKDGAIHETKASFSSNFLYDVIRKGKWKLGHLAQLITYMIEFEQTLGWIMAGYYVQDINEKLIQQETRKFCVEIESNGKILVDGESTGYTVHNVIKHKLLAAETLVSQKIPDRPIINGWGSPCRFCSMRDTCTAYDNGDINDKEFKEQGLVAVNNEQSRAPVIKTLKRIRRKK